MINKELDFKIYEWIQANKERILKSWIELCKIPSIKSEAEEGAPFGINCAKALEYSADLFRSEGIRTELYSNEGYALATYGNGEKKIGLFCHSDVVPVGEDWLFTEPFNPIIKEGALIGRGSEDNKSGIIASLCITEFLRDNNINLKSALQTFIGSDEECGMQDLINYLAMQKMPDVSIVPDADFPCSTGEKGIYHFWCKCKDSFSDIISISGGEAFNIVLDKVLTKIKYSQELYQEILSKTSDKNTFTVSAEENVIKIQAKGIAKHASIPDGSLNAAYLTAELLSVCENLCENDRSIMSKVKEILSDSYGKSLNVLHNDINFGKTTTVNGIVKTEDNKICLSFDCRYGDTYSSSDIENNSENTLKNFGFDVTYKDNREGFSIDKNSIIPLALVDIYAECTGTRLNSVLMSGGTYARRLKNAFSVGTFIIKKDRETPVLEMPDGHGGAHQCDEMIDIEGFFEALRVILHYILACDELINE